MDVAPAVLIGGDAQRLSGHFDVKAVTQAMQNLDYVKDTTDGGCSKAAKDRSPSPGPPDPLRPPMPHFHRWPRRRNPSQTSPTTANMADCLDDVYTADIYGKRAKSLKDGYVMFGIAATADSDGQSRERLCALTTSADSAQRIARKLRAAAQEDKDFAGAKVTTGSGDTPMVTMEWKNHAGLRPRAQNKTLQIPSLLLNP